MEPTALAGVFALAVALGILARSWAGRLMANPTGAELAIVGGAAAVLVNNHGRGVARLTPASSLQELLLGLNVGPNLAVTGSLSALIWHRAATTVNGGPSAVRLSRWITSWCWSRSH